MLQLKQRKNFPQRALFAALILTGVLTGPIVVAQEPASEEPVSEETAFEIATRSDRSDRGFTDSNVEVMMVLRNAARKETSRRLEIATQEIADESVGDRTLVLFTAPRDIDGTALLSHAHILKADDQWLFLPSVKRIKRISTANKSGPFVGSEFAFEDMTGQELNKYAYAYLEERPCGEFTCDVLERRPLYEGSAYTRQIAWIDRTAHQLRRVEFFDRKNDLLKTLDYKEYRQYEGGVWRAHLMRMENHQTGKSTDLKFETYEFGLDYSDQDFEKGSLSRLR